MKKTEEERAKIMRDYWDVSCEFFEKERLGMLDRIECLLANIIFTIAHTNIPVNIIEESFEIAIEKIQVIRNSEEKNQL